MATEAGFRRTGISLGVLLSLIWTVPAILLAVVHGFSLNGFGVWAGGLLVTYLVPYALMVAVGWIVAGFRENGKTGNGVD